MENTKRIGNYLIEIVNDESPESPRTSWDNFCKMVCFHKRYDLGDKHDYNHNDYDSWQEMEEAIIANENVHTILPLYLYDHSGITIATSPFGCRFDSGQIGFIYITKEVVAKENIKENVVEALLKSEVLDYDTYLRGEVYGYQIYKIEECDKGHEHKELVDSCWGYYDEDQCMQEAESLAAAY
jgi:hypothetical protein